MGSLGSLFMTKTFLGIAVSTVAGVTAKYGLSEDVLNHGVELALDAFQFGGLLFAAYGRWAADQNVKTGGKLAPAK